VITSQNLKLHYDSKTQCSTKSSKHSEVSKEGVATSASKQTSSLKHITRKLATTYNASTPLRSGANTRQAQDLNELPPPGGATCIQPASNKNLQHDKETRSDAPSEETE
jgi:hypothetical protein